MKFYNRENELAELERIRQVSETSNSKMTVLTGRRRIGKTLLVQKMLKGHDGVYLFVARKSEADLCSQFIKEIMTSLGEYIPESVKSFAEIFKMLMIIGQRRKFSIFIDEFQEFMNINASVFSDIQNIWDTYSHQSNINLILSGSVFSMMEKIFKDSKEPLFGRADVTMKLKPFRTDILRTILADFNPEYTNDDLLCLYMITGGVPKYVELLMDNGCTTVDSMIDYVVKPDNPFIDEGRNLLIQELGKQYGTYFSILGQIANGEVSQAEIESMLNNQSIGGQLKILEERFDLISKRRPICSKEGSQTVRFEIKDNFLRFWFRYIDRYQSLIEIGNNQALGNIIKSDYNAYSGFVLERWFRSKLMESGKYSDIGGWWLPKNKQPHEIDIVAIQLSGQVEAYECKRQKKNYNLNLMESKVFAMRQKIFKGRNVDFGCLSLEDM